jgi:hypothetical protein
MKAGVARMTYDCRKDAIILLIFLSFTLASGCVTKPPGTIQQGNSTARTGLTTNVSSPRPDLYTSPIGAFRESFEYLIPDSHLETEYVFYSRNWGPGEVQYNLTFRDSRGQPICDWLKAEIEPRNFSAEPGHTYRSRVNITIGRFPRTIYVFPPTLTINVSLQDGGLHLCNDSLALFPGAVEIYAVSQDMVSMETTSIVLKRGETREFNITYQRRGWAGLGEIGYSLLPTPLNVTIKPSNFIVKQSLDFPSVVAIAADSHLTPGVYPVKVSVKGASDWLFISLENGQIWVNREREKTILVKVTVVK